MLAFLRDANDSQSVPDIFERLYLELRPDIFMAIMPLVLTDNGSEFSNLKAIEYDRQGNQRTHLFYCDASSPGQKGSAEKNHEFIRYALSFDSLTQEDIPCLWTISIPTAGKALGTSVPMKCLNFSIVQRCCVQWGAIGFRRTK